MGEVIGTAGLGLDWGSPVKAPAENPRRAAVRVIRTTLRKQDASDDELDDALEALLELAKD